MSKPKLCVKCPTEARHLYKDEAYCSTCINAVPADAPITSITLRKRNRGKSIDEIETKKNYSGEASPYWDDHAKQPWHDQNNPLSENVEANPDGLPESASLYAYAPGEDEELRIEILRDVVAELTPRQQEILSLCEAPGYTEEKAAKQLGITRLAFRTTIDRIKAALQTKYEQRKRSSSWQK